MRCLLTVHDGSGFPAPRSSGACGNGKKTMFEYLHGSTLLGSREQSAAELREWKAHAYPTSSGHTGGQLERRVGVAVVVMVCAKLSIQCFMSISSLNKSVLIAHGVSFIVRDWICEPVWEPCHAGSTGKGGEPRNDMAEVEYVELLYMVDA